MNAEDDDYPCGTALQEWSARAPKASKGPVLVAPGVFVGNRQHASDLAMLQALHVSAVVNCGAGKNTHEGVLHYHKVRVADTLDADLLTQLDAATQFIDAHARAGRRVLVHCMGGVSRSPAVTAAYLVRWRALSLDDALALVRARRRCANPNAAFMAQLRDWEQLHSTVSTPP